MVPGYGGELTKAKMGLEHVVLFFMCIYFHNVSHFYSSLYWYRKGFYFPPDQFAAAFSH